MITIQIQNKEVKVQGTFNMGYMGVYKDDDILAWAGDSLEDIKLWDILSDNLDMEHCTNEDIARFLTDYFNEFEKRYSKIASR